MHSRRTFLMASIGTVAAHAINSSAPAAAQASLPILGQEQGDPLATPDPVSYDPNIVAQLISPISSKSFSLVDSVPDFPALLIDVAKDFDGFDRQNNRALITKMLNLFGCPFEEGGHPLAFCAAGIGYCATLVLARSNKFSEDNATLRKLLPAVDFYNYYPSPGVLNMSEVARGKLRWIEPDTKAAIPAGALAVFDWTGSSNPLSTSHTAIVLSADADTLQTFEFNTTNQANPTGGAIGHKTRGRDKTVKGFVATSTRKIEQMP